MASSIGKDLAFYLQEGRVLTTLSQPANTMKCGMCMALQFYEPIGEAACHHLLAGYEDGTLALWDVADRSQPKAGAKAAWRAHHGAGNTRAG